MAWWIFALIFIGAAAVILIGVVIVRTLAFRPKKEAAYPDFPVRCDEKKAVGDLAAMVRCKTVSDTDEEKENEEEFEKFEALLPVLFP